MGRHLATFTRRPGSSLYTLATEPPHVAASAQVSASGQVAPPCSCRLMSHQTLLWHHRLGHPSLPRLHGMHSRLLVSGLPRSLPPLQPSPAPPCLPCVEGWQRAAPHSSSFPPTTAPLQTLHMDVWGPARVNGQDRERYFLLVIYDYTWYATVFLLRIKGEVPDVLIPWIRAVRLQLRERFREDLPVLRLHSGRGGELSSDLLREFCRGEGILQSFTLSDSPQQNGIAERRIGLVTEFARTYMIHAAAPHFLWPFAIRYTAHQLNLWPRVSLPETSPTLRWTGKVGDASMFRVWGSRAFVRDTSANKLSARGIPCDVTFDESVPFYCLFPYRSAPPPPPPLFLAPGPPQVDPLPPKGPAPLGVSQADLLPGIVLVEVAVDSGAARGAAYGGVASGGAEPWGAEAEGAGSRGAEPEGAESGGAEPAGVDSGGAKPAGVEREGAEPRGTASSGDSAAGDTGGGGAGVSDGASGTGGAAAAGPEGARTRGTGAARTGGVGGARAGGTGAGGAGAVGARAGGTGAGGAGAGGARAVDLGARGAGGTVRPRPYFVPLLQQVLHLPSSTGLRPPLLCPPLDQSQPPLQPASPLLAPSPYTEQTGGLTERLLVAELLDLAAACRLDNVTALVAESESASPPSVRDPDAPDIPTPHSYAEAITGPYSSQWQATMDAEMASWKSTGTYVHADPLSRANIVDGTWIFRVKRPQGSLPAFRARYVARGFRQRQGVDYFQTFSPTPKMTTLQVLLHVAAQRDYELHSLDFSTAFLQGSLHEEIGLRRPPGFIGSFPASTQWSLKRPVYGLRQAPREWHDTLRTTLAALGFTRCCRHSTSS
ncbi:unnamed protein product [Closterium sp. NIES-54]